MIRIDPDDGAVLVELPNGETVSIDGMPSGAIERGDQRALFISAEEADVLGKMIDYILDKVKVRPESQAALQAVRPRLPELFGSE